MRICIVNQSSIPDADVQQAIRSINAQLADVAYHWSILAQCRLEGARYRHKMSLKEIRGDGLLYITDDVDEDALGWHDADQFGLPYGVIYTGWSFEPWTVTLSHEVLEMVVDPHCNRLAIGPHPLEPGRRVMHWMEICDAVQGQHYEIGGIAVSDFVLPGYFTEAEEKGMRMSYLGADIASFGVADGGYVGYYDPQLGDHDTYASDQAALAAMCAKGHGRSAKYRRLTTQ